MMCFEQSKSETESSSVVARGRNRELLFNGYRVSVSFVNLSYFYLMHTHSKWLSFVKVSIRFNFTHFCVFHCSLLLSFPLCDLISALMNVLLRALRWGGGVGWGGKTRKSQLCAFKPCTLSWSSCFPSSGIQAMEPKMTAKTKEVKREYLRETMMFIYSQDKRAFSFPPRNIIALSKIITY